MKEKWSTENLNLDPKKEIVHPLSKVSALLSEQRINGGEYDVDSSEDEGEGHEGDVDGSEGEGEGHEGDVDGSEGEGLEGDVDGSQGERVKVMKVM